jgi:hypothetical protein
MSFAKALTIVLAAVVTVGAAAPSPSPIPSPLPVPSPPSAVRLNPSFISARDLGERCRSSAAITVSYCYAYVAAVHDTVRAYETWLRIREFCPPLRASQADLRKAFVDYMDRHPGAGGGEAASVVVVALKERFGCAPSDRPAQ